MRRGRGNPALTAGRVFPQGTVLERHERKHFIGREVDKRADTKAMYETEGLKLLDEAVRSKRHAIYRRDEKTA